MMKAQDLMAGDWISTPKGYAKVIALDKWGITAKTKYNGEIDSSEQDVDFEPIPLTPEILEKNGFIYNEMPFVQGWEQFGLTLYRGGDGYLVNCGVDSAMKINAVHELQHALRLCGIKLNIEV